MHVIQDSGWFKNSWTDYGVEHLGASDMGYAMSIGTGTGATTGGMVDLVAQTARQQTVSLTADNNGTPNYDFYDIKYERYNPGVGTGLITEIGMHTANADDQMTCRALLITPMDKQAANTLDMYYRANCTPDLNDYTGSVLVNGVNYDYTVRPYDVDEFVWAWHGIYPGSVFSGSSSAQNINPWDSKAGTSGGTMHKINSVVDYPNKIRNWSTIAYLDECVFNIKSVYSRFGFSRYVGTEGGVGVGFVATDGPDIGGGIPKDNTEYFTVDWNVTWDETP
jgi:hypothetical protein